MSTTATTTSLGTSNLRGSSRQTRNLPARTSRNARASLRQNSLLSAAASAQDAPHPEPHGMYPAITHFTDAITALPRDFRRHTSLLKEVDAKAWALEENLQTLLKECLHERQTRPANIHAQTIAGSASSVAGDVAMGSSAGSINGNVLDTASQYSNPSVDQYLLRRRRLYAELRSNLMQMIMPLDEKNHVINNANEELSRHTRRQDEIWPHIADEVSEETRLGSLKHWALTDLNPTKKVQAAAARGRDLAAVPDNEVAERSERRREAMALAKKQKAAQHADSDAELRKVSRKGAGNRKLQELEDDSTLRFIANMPLIKVNKPRAGAGKKAEDNLRKTSMQAVASSVAMSRENSQQDNSKKRKAPAQATTVARKRINAAAGDSPKLGHSAIVAASTKDAPKRSPALSTVKPATGRGRQSSTQSGENSNRPASSASRRNGVTATGSELERVAVTTGKTVHEVKNTMKETVNSRGEKLLEEDIPDSVENRLRGGVALERSASKSSQLKKDDATVGRRTASPRLNAAATLETKSERTGKSKASKTATPTAATFADADASESAAEATSTAENGGDPLLKLKRPARPRMKDHHGLHDSLSPKGLPTKRTHKKNGSYYSLSGSFSKKDEESQPQPERKTTSRANSRSTKNASQTDHEGRNASSTPRIGADLVDEPDSMPSDDAKPQPSSRRQSQKPPNHVSTGLDLKPPPTTSASRALQNATSTAASPLLKDEPLGSPGPGIDEDADIDDDEPAPVDETSADADVDGDADIEIEHEDDEDDPNEQRYCYCNGVSYGEMVACDNEGCAREWFHLECTGLRALPSGRSTWFCEECKGTMGR